MPWKVGDEKTTKTRAETGHGWDHALTGANTGCPSGRAPVGIEHEVAVSLGMHAPEVADARRGSPQSVGLTVDEAAKVLSLIERALPVVNVFFELGREGGSAGVNDLEAFRLVDITRHARLQTMEQLADCLNIINTAVRSVRGDANASLYGLDQRGYCFIAGQTHRSIQPIWQEIVMERSLSISGAPRQEESTYVSAPGAATTPVTPPTTANVSPLETLR
jgi:hypothetical protein